MHARLCLLRLAMKGPRRVGNARMFTNELNVAAPYCARNPRRNRQKAREMIAEATENPARLLRSSKEIVNLLVATHSARLPDDQRNVLRVLSAEAAKTERARLPVTAFNVALRGQGRKKSSTARMMACRDVLNIMQTSDVRPNELTEKAIVKLATDTTNRDVGREKKLLLEALKHPVFLSAEDGRRALTSKGYEAVIKSLAAVRAVQSASDILKEMRDRTTDKWRIERAYRSVLQSRLDLVALQKDAAKRPTRSEKTDDVASNGVEVADFVLEHRQMMPTSAQITAVLDLLSQENARINAVGRNSEMHLKTRHAERIERLLELMARHHPHLRFVADKNDPTIPLRTFAVLMDCGRWDFVADMFSVLVDRRSIANEVRGRMVLAYAKRCRRGVAPRNSVQRFVANLSKCGWTSDVSFLGFALRACSREGLSHAAMDVGELLLQRLRRGPKPAQLYADQIEFVLRAAARAGDAKMAETVRGHLDSTKRGKYAQRAGHVPAGETNDLALNAYLNDPRSTWPDVIQALVRFSKTQSFEATELQFWRVLNHKRLARGAIAFDEDGRRTNPSYWVRQLVEMLESAGRMPFNAYHLILLRMSVGGDGTYDSLAGDACRRIAWRAEPHDAVAERHNALRDIYGKAPKSFADGLERTKPSLETRRSRKALNRDLKTWRGECVSALLDFLPTGLGTTALCNAVMRESAKGDFRDAPLQIMDAMSEHGVSWDARSFDVVFDCAKSVVEEGVDVVEAMRVFFLAERRLRHFEACFDGGLSQCARARQSAEDARRSIKESLARVIAERVDASVARSDLFESVLRICDVDDEDETSSQSAEDFRRALVLSVGSDDALLELIGRMRRRGIACDEEAVGARFGDRVESLVGDGRVEEARDLVDALLKVGLRDIDISMWAAWALRR